MFRRKKINTIIKNTFKIPQIDPFYDGLLLSKKGFEKSDIASPISGSNVKDIISNPRKQPEMDVRKSYDSFRIKEEKKIKEDELISLYGTKYPEYRILNKAKVDKFFEEDNINNFNNKQVNDSLEKKSNNSVNNNIYNTNSNKDFDLSNNFKDLDISNEAIFLESDISIEENIEKDKENKVNFKSSVFSNTTNIINDQEYILPPISLFKKSSLSDESIPEYILEKKEIINKVLSDFDVDGSVISFTKGPSFTRYEISLESGVKVSRVSSLYENFQMELKANSIRILAPIPGKKTVGIEVPNDIVTPVLFGDIVSDNFVKTSEILDIPFGRDIDGNIIYKNILDMPHGLIAGATKSGKSVCINSLLISLLIKTKPSDLKLILIDPKKVELSFYEELPHLATPVITDSKMASLGLKWAVSEMERRYDILSSYRVRNLESFNEKIEKENINIKKMPYIVIIIDELSDLMMTCSQDVEDSIKRITQKARAAGIHLIVATQRPSVKIISGNIKANIPTRVAFRVASYQDSNIILDEAGAENLLGKGDMLIKDNDVSKRVQGALISDDEINSVCDFIRNQQKADYLFMHEELIKKEANSYLNPREQVFSDELIYSVAKFCIEEDSASMNLIQKNFRMGFDYAKALMLRLEELNIVGYEEGSKIRKVLMSNDQLDNLFNKDNNNYGE